jgi:hypothetical protein
VRLEDRGQLEVFLERADRGQFVYQAFVAGTDLDCSCLCDEGRIVAYTIQRGLAGRAGSFGPALLCLLPRSLRR